MTNFKQIIQNTPVYKPILVATEHIKIRFLGSDFEFSKGTEFVLCDENGVQPLVSYDSHSFWGITPNHMEDKLKFKKYQQIN